MALRSFEAWLLAAHVLMSVTGLVLIKTQAPVFKLAWQQKDALWSSGGLLALGVASYIAGFVVWLIVLARNELSVVYPIAVGSTLALSSLLAVFMLGEVLSIFRVIGILFILIGVIVIVRS